MKCRSREPRLFFGTLILLSAILTLLEGAAFVEGATDDFLAACWSPDSSKVAFVLPGKGDKDSLHIADADGPGVERILSGERLRAVAWAPSGEHIAVASAARAEAAVYLIDSKTMSREAVGLGRAAENMALNWSADSTRIVVQSDRSILLIRAEDKKVESLDDVKPPVSRVFFGATSPLSPDNKLLLAAGPVDVQRWTLGYRPAPRGDVEADGASYAWLVKAEGKRHTLPVVHDGSLAGPPLWSPNGKAITFMTRTQPDATARPAPTVWINMVSEVGTMLIDPVRITYPLSTVPVWSPSGVDAAYFWRDPTGKCMVGVVNAAFTSVVPLQQELERVLFASWDERANIFLIAVTSEREIICARLDVVSGEFLRLSELPAQFTLFLPSPNLTKLLLVTQVAGRPRLQIFEIETSETVELKP